jgi:hypothetical protein
MPCNPIVGRIYRDRSYPLRCVRVLGLVADAAVRVERVYQKLGWFTGLLEWVPYHGDPRTSTVRLDRWARAYEEVA